MLPALANPVFCAVDRPDLEGALALARSLGDSVGGVKLGLEFFAAQGPAGVRAVAEAGPPVFLDLKLHDIPNTVAGAVRAVGDLGAAFLTLHASGGRAMLEAAAEVADRLPRPPRLLAVTVLTSLDQDDLVSVGVRSEPLDQVLLLASLACRCGIGGIVCSPLEIGLVRDELGPDVLVAVPGVRPEGSESADQKRVLTPAEAVAAGADLLVVGRPITAAPDPAAAARAIVASLAREG